MTTERSTQETIPCVAGVLAGGHSRRMGQPKALLALPDGRHLIEHVIGVASEVTRDVVILGRSIVLPASLARMGCCPMSSRVAARLQGCARYWIMPATHGPCCWGAICPTLPQTSFNASLHKRARTPTLWPSGMTRDRKHTTPAAPFIIRACSLMLERS
jgi:hypothetical protein